LGLDDRLFGFKWEQVICIFYPRINLNIFWLKSKGFLWSAPSVQALVSGSFGGVYS
jgi:hypothetical protein